MTVLEEWAFSYGRGTTVQGYLAHKKHLRPDRLDVVVGVHRHAAVHAPVFFFFFFFFINLKPLKE